MGSSFLRNPRTSWERCMAAAWCFHRISRSRAQWHAPPLQSLHCNDYARAAALLFIVKGTQLPDGGSRFCKRPKRPEYKEGKSESIPRASSIKISNISFFLIFLPDILILFSVRNRGEKNRKMLTLLAGENWYFYLIFWYYFVLETGAKQAEKC